MNHTMNNRLWLKFTVGIFLTISLTATSITATALNILISNDDGLTSNVKALYTALKNAGHDVIVSIPCQGQSGMGAAILFYEPITSLKESCLNNAGRTDDPGVGPVTKTEHNYDYSDFYYVNGTPIMATAYGLDILAPTRWGKAPNLVLSGPNQGNNVGTVVVSSGTVSNVQFAASRGIPAIALSAGLSTEGKPNKIGNHTDNPLSATIANHAVKLIRELTKKAGKKPILPTGLALNVNFPEEVTSRSSWSFSRIGSYDEFKAVFTEDLSKDPIAQNYGLKISSYPGISLTFNTEKPSDGQQEDEAVVYKNSIAVSAMQIAYDHQPANQLWLRQHLEGLFSQ